MNLASGIYIVNAGIPYLGDTSEEIELEAGQVWTIMVAPGGLWKIPETLMAQQRSYG